MPAVKQEANVKTQSGENFTAVHIGPLAGLNDCKLEIPKLNRTVTGKMFVKDYLGATGMEVSMNLFPAGRSMSFYHAHKQNEEVYIFLKGKGQIQVDGENIDVQEGSIVRVGTKGLRTIRSLEGEDLQFICIQAREGSLAEHSIEDGIGSDKQVTW